VRTRHCFFCRQPFEPRRAEADTCVPCAKSSVPYEIHGVVVRVVEIDGSYVARRGDTRGCGATIQDAARVAWRGKDIVLPVQKVYGYAGDDDSDLMRESRLPHRSFNHRRVTYDIRDYFRGYQSDPTPENDGDAA
jgi:hypothetical protein